MSIQKTLLILFMLPILNYGQDISLNNNIHVCATTNCNMDSLHIIDSNIKIKNYQEEVFSNVNNIQSYISSQITTGCKLDIVLAFDISGSNTPVTCQASNDFVTSFLTELDPEMDGSITGVPGSNNVQVGLCTWSTLDATQCNNGGQGSNV